MPIEDKWDDEQVKEVVIQIIKNMKYYLYLECQIGSEFYKEVQAVASKLGFIKPGVDSFSTELIISLDDVSKCIDEIWGYILTGVLAPGLSGTKYSISHVHLTDYGKKVIQENINPYATKDYINEIKDIAGDLYDTVSELYLFESLKSFKFNCYLGSMVLLGGFSEQIYLNFLEEFKLCVQNQTKNNKIDKQKFISGKFKEFLSIINPIKKDLPNIVKHNLELWLNSFFNYVRQARNEVGHPTGKEMTREEIHAMLLIFPSYLKNLVVLLNHFKSNPIT